MILFLTDSHAFIRKYQNSNPRKTTAETKTRRKKTKQKLKTKQKTKNKKQKNKKEGGERNTTQPFYLVNRVEIIHIVDLMS